MDFTSNIEALDSKLTDRIDKAELDLHRMITEVENQVNHIKNIIENLNSDASINDKNSVTVARRITRVENFLRIPFKAE